MTPTIPSFRSKLAHWAPRISILFALLLVLLVCVGGLVSDLRNRRDLIYNAEISKAKSHVERTAVRIELDLKNGVPFDGFAFPEIQPWLVDHWKRSVLNQPNRLLAAIADTNRRVLSHSMDIGSLDAERPSERTVRNDYDDPWDEYGPGVFHVRGHGLTNGIDAIDIRVPLHFNGEILGFYHTALPTTWLEEQVTVAQRSTIRRWVGILAAICVIVLISSISLFRLGTHAARLEKALESAETKRLADLSRLIVGMAHELRNPLNAVRLNLFTSEKLIRGDSSMPQEDAVAMLHESVKEVERVDELIGQLLGCARVESSEHPWIRVHHEVQSTLHFMQQVCSHHSIQVDYRCEEPRIEARIAAKYFRQILLNLLQNALQAMPNGGRLKIQSEYANEKYTITIHDTGHGISAKDLEHIFEPFYSTRQEGTGLGLAVVKNLVESARGTVQCSRSPILGGMMFAICLPAKIGEPTQTTGVRLPTKGSAIDEQQPVNLGR